MSNNNYSLEIISHHPTFKNKNLRKYYVEGIDTVGAWGDEPFEIKFTNHTYQKVQVKITLDGTDIFTGEPATTEVSNKMWVVNGYGTMSLKAWPENNNGGAQLVFTSANNSVAVHTHGDLSSRGIIAAAVYIEGHVEPIRYSPIYIDNSYPLRSRITWGAIGGNYLYNSTAGSGMSSCTGTASNSFNLSDCSFNASSNASSNSIVASTSNTSGSLNLESLVSVGAGQHVDQKIINVTGLIKPTFTETVRVRYLWWDDLVAKLNQNNYPAPHASGFPGDGNRTNINLGSTPRIGNYGQAFPREKQSIGPSYLRI